jgi:type IV pilus assembly protein PilB
MSGEQVLAALRGAGLIDEQASLRASREAATRNVSVEEFLTSENIVEDGAIADAKSAALRVPRSGVPEKIDATLMSFIPEETVRTYQVVPLSLADGNIVVGMVNPDDLRAQEALKFLARQHRLNLGVFLISFGDWKRALRLYSPYQDDVAEAVNAMRAKTRGTTSAAHQKFVDLELESSRGEDAPITRMVTSTLKEAIQMGASDVHIEPTEKALRIRFRIDGELQESASLPPELVDSVIAQVKVRADMKLDERRVPQDGRFRSHLLGREIDFRVATFPTPLGEKVAIRILDSASGLKTFEQLGLVGRNLDAVVEALNEPYGMVLVTGPTGSGKTTTLYAALQRINSEKVNIVSLEDPVEYFVEGVNQSQVRPEIGYDFAAGLRQILRQDPDVIMVGEIRDRETADLAVNAALTGHVVLSTLHTNDAAGVAPRLIDMGVEPFLIPAALNLMVAQRLVGRLCEACRVAEPASDAVAAEISAVVATMPEGIERPAPPYQVYRAPGCDKCHGRGSIGRMAIYEVIKMNRAIEKIVTEGASSNAIRDEARKQGAMSMRQDGVVKALQGLVLLEEVFKETNEGA